MDFDGLSSHTSNIWQFVMRLLFQSNGKEIVFAKTPRVSIIFWCFSVLYHYLQIKENIHDSSEHKKWSAFLDLSGKRQSNYLLIKENSTERNVDGHMIN